jgi:hypothetical protein
MGILWHTRRGEPMEITGTPRHGEFSTRRIFDETPVPPHSCQKFLFYKAASSFRGFVATDMMLHRPACPRRILIETYHVKRERSETHGERG